MQILSMAEHNDFVEAATLDGTLYKLHFGWNPHEGWSVDVRDGQNADILRSIAIVPNFPLLNRYRRHSGIPPGELMAVVNDGGETLGREDFVTGRAQMVYVPEAEVKDALAAGV